ncbi:MAG TPA: YfiR family protein [Gemmatimonadales bacterium]|jgi:hypothetical protein
MSPRVVTSLTAGLLLAGLLGGSAGGAWAQDTPVPVELQVQIMVKILNFDRKLPERVGGRLTVGVLYQGRYRTSANVGGEVCRTLMGLPRAALGALETLQLSCLAIDLDETPDLAAALKRERIQVLYVSPLRAFAVEDVVALTRAGRITTLTGVPRYVETGCAIGVDMKGDRPEILINLPASRAEGAELNAQLLKLARVVGNPAAGT